MIIVPAHFECCAGEFDCEWLHRRVVPVDYSDDLPFSAEQVAPVVIAMGY